jgi:hypothetical protein
MEFQIVEVYMGRYEFSNIIDDYDENEDVAVWSFIRKVKPQKEFEAVEVTFEKCFVLCKASDKSIFTFCRSKIIRYISGVLPLPKVP